jgi:uncharacterized membrane protein
MDTAQFWYLPLTLTSFAVLVALFLLIFVLIPLGLMKYAYERLGVNSIGAVLLLLASLGGSYINIPIAVISQGSPIASHVVVYFGMHYQVPPATDWGGSVLAVNVGGAVIPALLSAYLLIRWQLWLAGLATTVAVAAVCYRFSSLVPGLGIAVPVFIPAIAATIAALLLSRKHAAPLAYIAGSFGTLIGTDLMNLWEAGRPQCSDCVDRRGRDLRCYFSHRHRCGANYQHSLTSSPGRNSNTELTGRMNNWAASLIQHDGSEMEHKANRASLSGTRLTSSASQPRRRPKIGPIDPCSKRSRIRSDESALA